MGSTLDLGRRIELVSMDPHCSNITIGLYDSAGDSPEYLIHSYSGLPAAGPRLAVAHVEPAKAAQIDRLARLHSGDNGLQARREHGVGLGLRELHGGGDVVDELCFLDCGRQTDVRGPTPRAPVVVAAHG